MNNQNSVIEHKSPQNNELRRVLVVKATHEYVPVNNDELHIRVNDHITITNAEEGGWWEGTLGSRTGWFPSNYVVPLEDPLPTDKLPSNDEYKSVIVTELLESEIAYVREMEEFNENFLKKLHNLVSYQGDPVINTLNCAYVSLINAHKTHVLTPLQGGGLRVGKIFMTGAPEISAAHTSYCSNHPKFVQFVERNSDKLSGAFGDQAGVLKVISSLSAPFRRVEKYGNLLSELERYVCSFDPDKGDVQRGACYYRNLEKSLTSLRKQKEMELEILTSVRSGAIQDYEGPEVAGEIILMNLVFVGRDKQPRYFVLFSNTILILSYDNVSNTLTYKGRIYVSGITVSCIDGDDTVTHAFEISGPTLHPILVQCPSSSVRQTWLQNLNDLVRSTRCYSNPTPSNQVNSLPFVRLVEHFKHLHSLGLIVSKSLEFIREFKRASEINYREVVKGTRLFRKHACLSNINVKTEGGSVARDEFVTRSLVDVRVREEVDREVVSLPRDFSCGRRRLVRQDAIDLGSNDSVDSGVWDGVDVCSSEVTEFVDGVYVSNLYACWFLNLRVGEEL